jgi:quercetin dioxygenase-like cupin family protein
MVSGHVARGLVAAAACWLAACASPPPSAPPAPGIQRTVLQRFDIEGGREVVLGLAVIAPGVAAGRHTHFGIETGYLVEGSATLEIDGEPPRTLRAGDSFFIPAGRIHDARALGDAPVKVLSTWIVEKGKPLATPAR